MEEKGADIDFGSVGLYNKLFGKVRMCELRAGDKSLFDAVEGDKIFGVEGNIFSTLTAGSKRV